MIQTGEETPFDYQNFQVVQLEPFEEQLKIIANDESTPQLSQLPPVNYARPLNVVSASDNSNNATVHDNEEKR